jgi:hypothetical protein
MGVGIRSDDNSTTEVLSFDPATKRVAPPFPGVSIGRRARRGSPLGERMILREDDGVHVIDSTGDRLVIENTPASSYWMVVCRTATTCYAARNNENADVWERSMAEAPAATTPAKP